MSSQSKPMMETRTAQEVAEGLLSRQPSETSMTTVGQTASKDELAEAVSKVFALLEAHFPRKFPSIWKDADSVNHAKRAWFRAFSRCAWLNAVTLAAGLDRVSTREWPTDNPGEFLQLCHRTPEMVSAPELDAAFNEACRGAYPYNAWHKWSHRCVYWAATWTGLSDLNERPNAKRKAFECEYQRALDQFELLAEPPKADLPPPPPADDPGVEGAGFQAFVKVKQQLFGGVK